MQQVSLFIVSIYMNKVRISIKRLPLYLKTKCWDVKWTELNQDSLWWMILVKVMIKGFLK